MIDHTTPETQELFKQVKENKINIIESNKGQQLRLGTAIYANLLWPDDNSWNRKNGNWQAYLDDFNDSSQVMTIKYDKVLFMMTGDAGVKILERITTDPIFLQDIANSEYRILKVSHHGSKDGSSEKFLDILKPHLAVISLGKENTFGHPHIETLEALRERNIPVLRTDQIGHIEIISDGKKVWTK